MLSEKPVNTELEYSLVIFVKLCSGDCRGHRDTLLRKSFAGGAVECAEV